MIRILAQTIDREVYLRSMHQQFSKANPHLWWEILLGVVLVGGLVGVAWMAWACQRWRSRRVEAKPMELYRHVLAGIGLPPGDRWRLWRLARVVRMAQPTAALISEQMYDEAVAQYCAGRGLLGSRQGAAAQFAAIRAQLFGK